MNKTLNLVLKGVKVLIILVGILLTYLTLSRWQSEWGEGTDVFGLKILEAHPELNGPLSAVIMLCIALIIATFSVMLIFWIINLIRDPKAGLPSILGIVAIVIIAIISYNMASDYIDPTWSISDKERQEIVEGNLSKLVGAGIYMVYIMGIITVGAIVVTEVRKLIK